MNEHEAPSTAVDIERAEAAGVNRQQAARGESLAEDPAVGPSETKGEESPEDAAAEPEPGAPVADVEAEKPARRRVRRPKWSAAAAVAVVVVASTSEVTNAAGSKQDSCSYRLIATVTRDGDQLKMSKVEFVP
ncbi:hypothetical protein [Mycobacterium sp. HUMS_1102779]